MFSFNKQITNINRSKPNNLTIITCWYVVKSKFTVEKYVSWIHNFLSIVNNNNVNVVLYTDLNSFALISSLVRGKNVKIVFKNFENFYTYKFKDDWIKNHNKGNLLLHKETSWMLNMLWNEKIFFIQDALKMGYFDTTLYAWCDIGYFRNGFDDLNTKFLKGRWPNNYKLTKEPFSIPYIHYGCIQKDNSVFVSLQSKIKSFYKEKKEGDPNPDYNVNCFAGGFFLIHRQLIVYYAKIYADKLQFYFSNNYFIKDDQIIITDIIFNNPNLFYIHNELTKYNNWFMFQRLLL